jgi:hypothetical protein
VSAKSSHATERSAIGSTCYHVVSRFPARGNTSVFLFHLQRLTRSYALFYVARLFRNLIPGQQYCFPGHSPLIQHKLSIGITTFLVASPQCQFDWLSSITSPGGLQTGRGATAFATHSLIQAATNYKTLNTTFLLFQYISIYSGVDTSYVVASIRASDLSDFSHPPQHRRTSAYIQKWLPHRPPTTTTSLWKSNPALRMTISKHRIVVSHCCIIQARTPDAELQPRR